MIRQAVGVDARGLTLCLGLCRNLQQRAQAHHRLAKAAEYHLVVRREISHLFDDLLRRGLVFQPQLVPADALALPADTEFAVVGALVGQIDVQIVSICVGIGICHFSSPFDLKQSFAIFAGILRHLFIRHVTQLCQLLHHIAHMRGFIALAAHRHRRQIGAIGLYHKAQNGNWTCSTQSLHPL